MKNYEKNSKIKKKYLNKPYLKYNCSELPQNLVIESFKIFQCTDLGISWVRGNPELVLILDF